MKTATAIDWPKCFCIYRLKCSKATGGWLDGRMEISRSPYSKSTCGANNTSLMLRELVVEIQNLFVDFRCKSKAEQMLVFIRHTCLLRLICYQLQKSGSCDALSVISQNLSLRNLLHYFSNIMFSNTIFSTGFFLLLQAPPPRPLPHPSSPLWDAGAPGGQYR